MVAEMAKQTRQAVAEADAVIFVVDVRAGLSAQDHDIARYLRAWASACCWRPTRPRACASRRCWASSTNWAWASRTRCRPRTGRACAACWRRRCEGSARIDEAPSPSRPTTPIRLAVAGRPNVGKSTLINTWLGEERLVAFDQPGTTRDAIHVPFERDGQKFSLIDTAGLRRKGKVFEAIEKFSVVKTLQAIADANVVVLLLDATQGVSDQDAHIAGYILESGRAVVLAVNKWDATDDYQRQSCSARSKRLAFLKFAPVLHISAAEAPGPGAAVEGRSPAGARSRPRARCPRRC
jgi:GTP-binding protein